MTIINGANNQTVEDLLSSIRHSIADDSNGMRQGPSSPLNHPMMARRDQRQPETRSPETHHSDMRPSDMRPSDMRVPDEHAEFELPAIFKPGHHNQHADKPNNLFGRLSDALKAPPATEPDRSRTVIRFEPAAAGRMIEPPTVTTAQASWPEQPPSPAEQPDTGNKPVKREMPSFFDARLNRMGEMTRQASAPKPVEPPPAPRQPMQQVQAVAAQPPPLRPQQPAADASAGGLEDAAAQLLRPILKQWLMENMPKIVEKALRSEAGDDFPPAGTPPDRRK